MTADADEAAIRSLVAALDDAQGDVDRFTALLLDDVVVVNVAGVRVQGREAFRAVMAAALRTPLAGVTTRAEVLSVAFPGPDLAVACAVKHVSDGRRGAYTVTARRTRDGWRVVSLQTTPIIVSPDRDADRAAAMAVIADVEAGFNANDPVLATQHFADDAFAVDVRGRENVGIDELRDAHSVGFAGPLADQFARYDVADVRFLGPDVALVRKRATAVDEQGAPMVPGSGHAMVAVYVLQRRDARWQIAARQNTLVPSASG